MKPTHAFVTGASAGIGRGIAEALARRGVKLTLVARRVELLEELADQLDVDTHVIAADLSDLDGIAGWVAEAEAALGPIDCLVNNAGVQVIGDTATVDIAAGERSVVINLFAPLRLIQAVLPGMLARGAGSIVNIASMASLAPVPRMIYYNAGKGGIGGASEALRGELLKTGVDVCTVYPGIIETDMGKAGLDMYEDGPAVRLQPRGTVEGLGRRVADAIERGKGRIIYPEVYTAVRHLPGVVRFMLDRFSPEGRG